MIRAFEPRDFPRVLEIWNTCVRSGEVVYFESDQAYMERKVLGDPNHDPACFLVYEKDGNIAGFIHGVCKKVYLPGETNENSPGYITFVFVDPAERCRGIGSALLEAMLAEFRRRGKKTAALCNDNPVNLDWHIPGTPGHDHNNAPGVDVESRGYEFFLSRGFHEQDREVAMYLNLREYVPCPDLDARRQSLRSQGIETGRYDPHLGYDFDRLCDRVGSNYWRAVLASETACHLENRPNTDIRFLPCGKVPAGPRPLLAATCGGYLVGFTGPVDLQESGRGWFCGICTDPMFEKRGIATVLFHLLMQEFIAEGAAFSTLFTGVENHAQKIYLRAGFRPVRRFAMMSRDL